MPKLTHAFSHLAFLVLAGTSVVACASAPKALPAANPQKSTLAKIDAPLEAIVESGVFYISAALPEEPREIFGFFQDKLIEFFPDPVPGAAPHRFSALVGVEYGTKPGKVPFTLKYKLGENFSEQNIDVEVKAGTFPSEALHVPPKTVVPGPKEMRRIKKDQAFLKRAYATKTTERLWDPPFVMPVSGPIVQTSIFGTSRVYNNVKHNPHLGTDLRAPTGTPLRAPLTGKVVCAHYLFFTGNTVILDHGYGFFTFYGHMSKLSVKEGDTLKKGQLMGLSGMTGRVSGPHLHWGVNLHGVKVDPLILMHALK